jgi:O-antigen/teichoic acid export membrane protein
MIHSELVRLISERKLSALSFRSNFAWNLVGNCIYAACQLGVLVVLARLGSAVDVGKFALGLSVAAPVIMLANMQLRQVQASDVHDQFSFPHYLVLRTLTSSGVLIVVFLISLVGGYQADSVYVIIIIGCAKCFESISDIAYGLFQRHERMDISGISMMINGPLSLIMFGVSFILTGSVVLSASILALTRLGVALGYDMRLSKAILRKDARESATRIVDAVLDLFKKKTGRKQLLSLGWMSFPLGIAMCLVSLHTNLPRLMLEKYLGEEALGMFAAVALFMQVGFVLERAMGQAALPRLSHYYQDEEHKKFIMFLLMLVGAALLIGVCGVVVVFMWGEAIINLIYGSEYIAQYPVLIWLMVAAGVGYIDGFFIAAMNSTRKYLVQIPGFVLMTVVSAVSGYIMIPKFGIVGTAISVLLAKVALLIVMPLLLYRVFRKRGTYKHPIQH